MDLRNDETLKALLSQIQEDQREFMQEEDVAYRESDIAECGRILLEHLTALETAEDATEGLARVRDTVEKLNRLNAQCEGVLIETDGREDICELITHAGALRGFHAEDEDVTEEWRDW